MGTSLESDIRKNNPVTTRTSKIDPTAPAGSEDSLGEESVRDGRPGTDSDVVEAIDEEGPDVTVPTTKDRS